MIIDIDIYSNIDHQIEIYHEQAISALKILQDKNNSLSFRVYETAGGLRAIETSRSWDPTDYHTKRIMKSVSADPLYIALCKSQECFRARLTPKPWRLFDYIDYDDFTTGNEWLKSTEESEVGVCKLLKVIGSEEIDSKFKDLITYHDFTTKALSTERLDLALV